MVGVRVGVDGSSFPCLTSPSKNSTESFRRTSLAFSIFSIDTDTGGEAEGEARIRATSSILDAVAGIGGRW